MPHLVIPIGADLIDIPAGRMFGSDTTIRHGIIGAGAGYFTVAPEIPANLLDAPSPPKDYKLEIFERPPIRTSYCHFCRLPTAQEALWAISFMNVTLCNQICEGPMRFLHMPFRPVIGPWFGGEEWRQLVVRRYEQGYYIGTVAARRPVTGFQLAYTFNP